MEEILILQCVGDDLFVMWALFLRMVVMKGIDCKNNSYYSFKVGHIRI